MISLDRKQSGTVALLLGPFCDHLVVPSIVHGNAPARCWVDNADTPAAAVVWDLVNGFAFCSVAPSSCETTESLSEFLLSELFPEAAGRGYDPLDIRFAPPAWLPSVRQELAGFTSSLEHLAFFSLSPDEAVGGRESPLPGNDLRLERITDGLLSSDMKNMDEIGYCVEACWRSRERYLNEGIGFCLIDGSQVASWCSTDYVVDGAADLYVETFDGYEGAGLGSAVSSACVDACLSKGWTVHWHCWSDNTGSVRVAKKIGLRARGASEVLRVALSGAAPLEDAAATGGA